MSTKKTMGLSEKAEKALGVAVKKALARHKALGVPAYVWMNGKVTVCASRKPKKHKTA